MKMIVRMFCAVALVAGALSLTGCGDKKDQPAADAVKGAADAVKK